MNRSRLKAALDSALDEQSSLFQNAVGESKKYPSELQEVMQNHELAKPVDYALALEDEFRDGAGFMVKQESGGYTGFQRQFVSGPLVGRARNFGSDAALDWLEKVLSTKWADGLCVLVLWGVQTPRQVKFSDGIELLPVSALPESRFKEWLLRPRSIGDVIGFVPQTISDPPQAALVCTTRVEPFLWDLREGEPPKQSNAMQSRQGLDDVRLALTLVSSTAPMEAVYWFQFIDPDLESASLFGGTSSRHPDVLPWTFDAKEAVDCEAAQVAADGFVSLEGGVKQRVKVALERLNLAMRRLRPAEKAVELAVSLEALLVADGGENTHKVGLRAALIVGGSNEERVWNRGVIGAIYTMRSMFLHQGHVSEYVKVRGRGKVKSDDIVADGVAVCKSVIHAVIRRRASPDWYEFELGIDRRT
jgi:hypothetical protein